MSTTKAKNIDKIAEESQDSNSSDDEGSSSRKESPVSSKKSNEKDVHKESATKKINTPDSSIEQSSTHPIPNEHDHSQSNKVKAASAGQQSSPSEHTGIAVAESENSNDNNIENNQATIPINITECMNKFLEDTRWTKSTWSQLLQEILPGLAFELTKQLHSEMSSEIEEQTAYLQELVRTYSLQLIAKDQQLQMITESFRELSFKCESIEDTHRAEMMELKSSYERSTTLSRDAMGKYYMDILIELSSKFLEARTFLSKLSNHVPKEIFTKELFEFSQLFNSIEKKQINYLHPDHEVVWKLYHDLQSKTACVFQEKDALHKTVVTLTNELEACQAQVSNGGTAVALSTPIEVKKSRFRETNIHLRFAEDRTKYLREIEDLNNELSTLKKNTVTHSSDQVTSLTQELEKAHVKYTAVLRKQDAMLKIEQVKSDNLNETATSLTSENILLKRNLFEHQQELIKSQQQTEKMREAYAESQRISRTLHEQETAFLRQLKGVNCNSANMLASTSMNNAKYEDQLKQLHIKMENLERLLKDQELLNSELEKQFNRLSNLRIQLKEQEAANSALERKVKSMEQGIADLKQAHTKKANELMEKFTRDVARIQRELSERNRLAGVYSNRGKLSEFNEEVSRLLREARQSREADVIKDRQVVENQMKDFYESAFNELKEHYETEGKKLELKTIDFNKNLLNSMKEHHEKLQNSLVAEHVKANDFALKESLKRSALMQEQILELEEKHRFCAVEIQGRDEKIAHAKELISQFEAIRIDDSKFRDSLLKEAADEREQLQLFIAKLQSQIETQKQQIEQEKQLNYESEKRETQLSIEKQMLEIKAEQFEMRKQSDQQGFIQDLKLQYQSKIDLLEKSLESSLLQQQQLQQKQSNAIELDEKALSINNNKNVLINRRMSRELQETFSNKNLDILATRTSNSSIIGATASATTTAAAAATIGSEDKMGTSGIFFLSKLRQTRAASAMKNNPSSVNHTRQSSLQADITDITRYSSFGERSNIDELNSTLGSSFNPNIIIPVYSQQAVNHLSSRELTYLAGGQLDHSSKEILPAIITPPPPIGSAATTMNKHNKRQLLVKDMDTAAGGGLNNKFKSNPNGSVILPVPPIELPRQFDININSIMANGLQTATTTTQSVIVNSNSTLLRKRAGTNDHRRGTTQTKVTAVEYPVEFLDKDILEVNFTKIKNQKDTYRNRKYDIFSSKKPSISNHSRNTSSNSNNHSIDRSFHAKN